MFSLVGLFQTGCTCLPMMLHVLLQNEKVTTIKHSQNVFISHLLRARVKLLGQKAMKSFSHCSVGTETLAPAYNPVIVSK